MENVLTATTEHAIRNANVFSEEFVANSIKAYFKSNGYRAHEEKSLNISGREEKVIIASTFFKKEVIEIKGSEFNEYPGLQLQVDGKSNTAHFKTSITDVLHNPLIQLSNYYRDENTAVSMAVPNVPRYKAIVERLQDYFTMNDMYFKIYMVDENGAVEAFNLNEHYSALRKG